MKLHQNLRDAYLRSMNRSTTIHISFLDIASFPRDRTCQVFYKLHSGDRQRSASYLKENDRLRFLAGRYLLQEYLYEYGVLETLDQIQYDAYKRPVLKNTNFSISHSENQVVLAAGCKGISMGIDLEVITQRHIPDHLEPFCEEERNFILEDNAQSRFYHAWTKKESALKAIGKGFLHNAQDVNTTRDHFVYDDKRYRWMSLDIASNVISHLCHDQDDIIMHIKTMPGQL